MFKLSASASQGVTVADLLREQYTSSAQLHNLVVSTHTKRMLQGIGDRNMFVFSWFPLACVSPSWLPCLIRRVAPKSEDSEIRICEFMPATACVLLRVCFSIWSSSQDSMHCTLSKTVGLCTPCQRASFISTTDSFLRGHDPYTLACKARPSLTDVGLL